MADKRAEMSSLLRSLADCLETADEKRVRQLLSGTAKLQIVSNGTLEKPVKGRKGTSRPANSGEILRLPSHLRDLQSIEAGYRLLKSAALTRRELEALARLVDVPVRKDIRAGELEDLIINATIGGRLNSLAIRGEQSSA